MTSDPNRVGQQRPGGRAARVRSDVLLATSELLDEAGYDAVNMEDVAQRAGVHKTTVYRRWPSKAELVFDAVSEHSARAVPVPDTGSLVGDLQAFARSVAANIGTAGGARRSRSIVAASVSSGDIAENMQDFWSERLTLATTIVERAIERKELPSGADPNLILETLIGPLWVRILLTGEPITEQFAERVADLVAAGATQT